VIKKTDIPNDTITYAKMQNAVADNVVIGNVLGAGEAHQELTAAQLAGVVDGELLIDEDDMSSDTDTKAPTQQSTKAYVDAQISANAPDVVLIDTQTASTSSTISFTGLSSTYAKYVVELLGVTPDTDTVTLQLRTSTDNGSSYDSGASDYSWTRIVTKSNTIAAAQDTADDSIELHAFPTGTGTNDVVNGSVTIFDPSATTYTMIRSDFSTIDDDDAITLGSYVGVRLSAADVDAIQFSFDSGNIASGTFKLYGYK
jgi:hypothetical protein